MSFLWYRRYSRGIDVIPAKAGIQQYRYTFMTQQQPAVYIMTSQRNGTLYTGVTSNLVKRIWEHKNNLAQGFTQKYNVHILVYYELHEEMYAAITREKQIKKWNRAWKLRLIEEKNPSWKDLYDEINL